MAAFNASTYNITEFCLSPNASDSEAICAVYYNLNELTDTVSGQAVGIDAFFLIFAGSLVFMMQTGFAMLCAGSVRQKNVKNILLKNILDACGGAVGFYCFGFGIAFGNGDQVGRSFMGTRDFGLRDYDNYSFFFFQFAFAASAATIVAGAVAERCAMAAYLCYSFFLTSFVYPIIVHSIWDNNGFLTAFPNGFEPFRGVGVIDFAGSGVVHLVGGTTALVAIIVLGPRRGRFYDDDGNPLEEPASWPPHSVGLQVLGTFILWFGWYGFNPGSALLISNPTAARVSSLAAVTTTMAAASGAVSCMFLDSLLDASKTGEVSYDLTCTMNGCLSGLVAVTSGCATMDPWGALIVGFVAGALYLLASKTLIKLRIDDAVDAVPVHFMNGMWGLIAAGLFSTETNMGYAGYRTTNIGWFFEWGRGSANANLFLAQICAVLWIIGFVGSIMLVFFVMLNAIGWFRVDPLEEEVGLDISHHRGSAYDLTEPHKEHVEQLMEVRASRHGKIEVPSEVERAHDVATSNEA